MPSVTEPTAAFVSGLPKAELHVHLEGTLEPDLKLALATRNGVDIGQSTVEEVRASYAFDSLASFLAVYYPAMNVLITEQDFYDLATAYFRRASADGVRHVEAFFDPQAHTTRGVPFETVITGLHRAAADAAGYGLSAELILCFLRDASAESAHETLLAALPYRDLIVGVGLDSDERGNPPAKFAEVFRLAREAGLRLTMHCDIDQVGSIENIRQVLGEVRVDRIDHGTNILEDPALVALVRERRIGLTCCPVSNSFVTSDMKAREIVELLRLGVLVTLNSDDPAYFGAYVADTYTAFARQAGIGRDELVQLARNSFEASWLSDADRQGYLSEIDAFLAANPA
ncbi:adenosine deaminase [Cryobacterium sp. MDB1-18-2]|uniref:adenosine deaminase n=1 Tax=unclassified Cryobacterium TaxID=2649013 RepID=UPI00106B7D48|nr:MULTISPECIES: adenosine deaminase [unclassified Cryobacterium]TFC24964.1 adenosine deaminase [Cryobacterium sp. MDB1-18-2]TFC45730.1 adenosine deaminase [Cryobacterium sp. MDB1-18-1]